MGVLGHLMGVLGYLMGVLGYLMRQKCAETPPATLWDPVPANLVALNCEILNFQCFGILGKSSGLFGYLMGVLGYLMGTRISNGRSH